MSDGLVAGREGLEQFLFRISRGATRRNGCSGGENAFEAAERGDLAAVMRLDGRLNAMKIARESREAGFRSGGRFSRT